ncbi:auxin-responsive protein SAUR50-like [Zingiber officinale]|uniref:auxin-responsive protein SAUR50-like n=1 Tax=Zingiber officinale TaxID=94328 RepID=UPI001C4BD7C6|nr:auxin-responsive protein SAUR50-like [Zingiber officinale]
MRVVVARRKRNAMPSAVDKVDKLRRIVRLKQAMRRWRVLSLRLWSSVRGGGGGGGSVAVYVGPDRRRFAVPARFFNLPVFAALLERAEEEYGFQPAGGLAIPCDPAFFRWVLDAIGEDQAHLAPLGLEAFLALFAASRESASVCREADACNALSPLLPKTRV